MSIPACNTRMVGAVFILLSGLVTAACFNLKSEGGGDGGRQEVPLPTVEMIKARHEALPLREHLSGQVLARNQTDIYAEISGRIMEVSANSGDRVRKGDILVRLRDEELRERLKQAEHEREVSDAQLRQAEAGVTRYRVQYRRIKELVEHGLESAMEMDMLEADIAQAEASVDLARAQRRRAEAAIEERKSALQNATVRAPIDGVLGNRNAEVGMRVDSGTRLFMIGDPRSMTVTITLTEQAADRFRRGDRVRIHSSYLDAPIESSILRISPFLDPVSHTTTAEIDVPDPGALQPGMFVSVDVFYGAGEKAFVLPKAVLFEHPGERRLGVYTVECNGAHSVPAPAATPAGAGSRKPLGPFPVKFRPVEVAAEDGDAVSVRGIDTPWVVVNGQNQLAEWDRHEAYVLPVEWAHVLQLQKLQARDLLDTITGSGQ